MAINFNEPTTSTNYATLVSDLKDAFRALGFWLDPTLTGTITSPQTGLKRLNESTTALQRYNGSSWVAQAVNGLSGTDTAATVAGTLRVNGGAYGTFGIRQSGAYGGAGPNTSYDDAVIENSGNAGLSFLIPNTAFAGLVVGDPESNIVGRFTFNNTTDRWTVTANGDVAFFGGTHMEGGMRVGGDSSLAYTSIDIASLNSTSWLDNPGVIIGGASGPTGLAGDLILKARSGGTPRALEVWTGGTPARRWRFLDGGDTEVLIGSAGRVKVLGSASGSSSLVQGHPGLLLTAAAMNLTSKYTPAMMFGSTDQEFTTTSPKVAAGVMGEASEGYAADTDGGMGLIFFTTPDNPGAAGGMVERWKMLNSGHLMPFADSSYNIGSASVRVANGYFDVIDAANLAGTTWSPSGVTGTLVSIATAVAGSARYTKINSTVNFVLAIEVTTTGVGYATCYVSLPVASAFASTYDLVGVFTSGIGDSGDIPLACTADQTNDRIQLFFWSGSAAARILRVSGSYTVI